MQTDSKVYQRIQAKAELKKALANYDGDTKNEIVANAIAKLATLNPTANPVENQELLQGDWLLINAPNFPDRLEDEVNRYVYTLGRLAFNKFEPVNLHVAISKVTQPVFATGVENEYTHDIVVEFQIIEPGFSQLTGIVKNLAVCTPVDQDTVQVKFIGGELMPLKNQDPEQLKQWLKIFGDNQQKSQISFSDRIKFWFVQTMFGMGKVSEANSETGTKYFEIRKSPKGLLKILYLDEELRITKGNRETVLICQRQV